MVEISDCIFRIRPIVDNNPAGSIDPFSKVSSPEYNGPDDTEFGEKVFQVIFMGRYTQVTYKDVHKTGLRK